MQALYAQLLRDFKLLYGEEVVKGLDSSRLQSLLTYLLLHRDAPQSRQRLAYLFWPQSSDSQARTNLRQLLYYLRQSLPHAEQFLQIDTHTLQWRTAAPFSLDVADFENAISRARQAAEADDQVAALEQAMDLYRGDLLPDCYDDWLLAQRERLSHLYVASLEQLIGLLEDKRDYAAAIGYAQRLLRYDPLHEATYRRLMRLHALNGDRARALHVYHDCATSLQRELGVAPSPATREAYKRLLQVKATPQPRSVPEPLLIAELPLVGRQQEWQHLHAAWHTAAAGRPHVAFIGGEAGIGKTRLGEELLTWARRQGIATARTRCYAVEGRLAYAPVTTWLRSETFRTHLTSLDDVWLTEVSRLLPELLAERPDLPHPQAMTEGWQRQRFFEALARAILAGKQPLLLLLDDLQWCDDETLQWLIYLLRFNPQAPLLLLGMARLEEVAADHPLTTLLLELRSSEQLTEILLTPLDEGETALLGQHVAHAQLDAPRAARLYRETEGNPLFVVETMRVGLPEPTTIASPQTLAPKVQAVIESRLAQLSPPARELAAFAAVIGREFTSEVLAEASDWDEDALVRGLDELWQRRIVREQGVADYDFSHDKLREVAYAQISVARRRFYHRRIAEALETIFSSALDVVSSRVAAHYRQASLPERAIPYYQQAGTWAIRLSAYEQAVASLMQGLSLLQGLPDAAQRVEQELHLQTALGTALVAVKGWGVPEVEKAYTRAQELCAESAEDAQLFPVLWGVAAFYVIRAKLSIARELVEQYLQLAKRQDDKVFLTAAYFELGCIAFHLGEFMHSQQHFEQARATYDVRQHSSYRRLFGPDLGVFNLAYASHAVWHLGHSDEALKLSQEALALADRLAHPFSQAIAQAYATMLHQFRGHAQAAQQQAEVTIDLCTEHGFAYYLAWATFIQGWALVEQDEPKEGIARMQQGLADLRATGARLRETYYLGLLAAAHRRAGKAEEAQRLLTEALASMDESDERFWEAELVRLQGELLQMQGSP